MRLAIPQPPDPDHQTRALSYFHHPETDLDFETSWDHLHQGQDYYPGIYLQTWTILQGGNHLKRENCLVRERACQLWRTYRLPAKPARACPNPGNLSNPTRTKRLHPTNQHFQDRNHPIPTTDHHLPAGNQQPENPDPAVYSKLGQVPSLDQ